MRGALRIHIDKVCRPVKMPAYFGITGWMCVNKKPPVTEPASKRVRKVKPDKAVKATREPSASALSDACGSWKASAV